VTTPFPTDTVVTVDTVASANDPEMTTTSSTDMIDGLMEVAEESMVHEYWAKSSKNGGSGKSGKAATDVIHYSDEDGYASADADHILDEDDNSASWSSSISGKSGKDHYDDSGSGNKSGKAHHVISYDDDDGWSTGTHDDDHTHDAKSGKAGADAGWWSSGGSGKSGKTHTHDNDGSSTWWSASWSSSSSGKSGKAIMSMDVMKGHDVKSGKAVMDDTSTTKPKAEKILAHYFIKETTYQHDHPKEDAEAKSGKSSVGSWSETTHEHETKSGKSAGRRQREIWQVWKRRLERFL